MNARQERWDRYFTAALGGTVASGDHVAAVRDATRVADEALAVADKRTFPKTALDKLLKVASAIDDMATYHERDGVQGHWTPAPFVIGLRKALAELRGAKE